MDSLEEEGAVFRLIFVPDPESRVEARPLLMTHYRSNLEPASLSDTFYIPSFSSPTIFRMTGVGPTRNPLTRLEDECWDEDEKHIMTEQDLAGNRWPGHGSGK